MFVDMLNVQRSQGHNISSLSTGIMAGSPCPQELCKAITKELNMTKFVVGQSKKIAECCGFNVYLLTIHR